MSDFDLTAGPQEEFNVGDSIIISADEYIKGLHNYNTYDYNKMIFGKSIDGIKIDRNFNNEIVGTIKLVGFDNMYLIESNGRNYVYCNNENEMRKV